MTHTRIIFAGVAMLSLASCGSDPVPDTSYEEGLPAPVEVNDANDAPAPDNDTVIGGTDEQVDAMASGDNIPVEETTDAQ